MSLPRTSVAAARRQQRTIEVEHRRHEIARLKLMKMNYREIVAALAAVGIKASIATVSLDIKAMRQEWREARLAEVGDVIDADLAVLDTLQAEAMREWERSKTRAKSRRRERGNIPGGIYDKDIRTTEDRCGDPRYLQIVNDCMEKRAKLLGLYKPEKHEHAGPGGERLIPIEAIRALQD